MAAKRGRQSEHSGLALAPLPPRPGQLLAIPAPEPDEAAENNAQEEDSDGAAEDKEGNIDEGSSTNNSNSSSSSANNNDSADEPDDASADEPAAGEPRTLEEARAKLTEIYNDLFATEEAFKEEGAKNDELRKDIAMLKRRVAELEARPADAP